MDGIKAAVKDEKTSTDLEKSLSKKYGEEDFYLDKDREYRSEEDVFTHYREEERDRLFGRAPETVWQNLLAFEKYPEKMRIFDRGNVMPKPVLESYRLQITEQWAMELHNRLVPDTMDFVRGCVKLHDDKDPTDINVKKWIEIERLKHEIAKDTIDHESLLTEVKKALDEKRFDDASDLQLTIKKKKELLMDLYADYQKNVI